MESCAKRCSDISKFFIEKIRKSKEKIVSKLSGIVTRGCESDPVFSGASVESLSRVTSEEVSTLIRKTVLKFSPVDIVPVSVIKFCPDIFGEIISRLANLSFSQGKFSTAYKLAQVKPLLKKSGLDPENPANYRPISNLSTISKLLEKIFLVRIKSVVCSSENFCKFQSAYQERHSTETALLKIFDDVYRNLDEQLGTILVTLDISAAFDCVNHEILLRRLQNCYGICGVVLLWVKSYLDSRSQFVKIQTQISETQELCTGVPQGSCLGPLLFCAYISTLAYIIPKNVSFHQYADDTQLYCGFKTSDY